MEVSFILSDDELLTLISLVPCRTVAGARFVSDALSGAELCDLGGLVDKRLARRVGEEMELTPVIRMVADALARSDSAENRGGSWLIGSPWVTLRCERYPYQGKRFRITPLKNDHI